MFWDFCYPLTVIPLIKGTDLITKFTDKKNLKQLKKITASKSNLMEVKVTIPYIEKKKLSRKFYLSKFK